jgi:hypothetical protein
MIRFKHKAVKAPNSFTNIRPVIPVQFIGSKEAWDIYAMGKNEILMTGPYPSGPQ